MTGQFLTIQAGTIGFDIGSKKRSAPKYQFNTTVHALIVGSEIRGCDEYARLRILVRVEGKKLSVLA